MMLSDLLLAEDVAVELCLSAQTGEIEDILESSAGKRVRCWIYSASIQKIHEGITKRFCKEGLEKKEASNLANKKIAGMLKKFHVLSSLSSDLVFFPREDLGYLHAQMMEAVKRLGERARILVLNRPTGLTEEENSWFISLKELSQILARNENGSYSFVDLRAQQDRIRSDLEKRIFSVLRHGQYIMGPEIGELEETLANYTGRSYCITCSSGTDALLMSLMALGIGPGDAVFTTPFTFIATAEVIRLVGATPVFVDIEADTFLICQESLKRAIEALKKGDRKIYPLPENSSNLRPKAIISVDLFGNLPDYNSLEEISKEQGLYLIEDAAQSFGAEYDGRRACSFGDIACTSFFPAKPLGCYGDGGAVFTDSHDLAAVLRSIRNHGMGRDRYEHIRLGLNCRMDTLQAAILLSKFSIFDEEISRRRKIASLYQKRLEHIKSIKYQCVSKKASSAWAQFCILLASNLRRNRLERVFKQEDIPYAIYYPMPLHLQPVFSDLGYHKGDFPVAEDCAEKIIALPIHPYVDEILIEKVLKAVEKSVF